MSERSVDYEQYLRHFGDGSIWLLKKDAIRLGAGYLPVRDNKTITTILRAPNDQTELNERTLLGAINDARLAIERPEMIGRDVDLYVNAAEFLEWLAQYIAQTQAQEIVFPNELASAIRKSIAKAMVSLQPNAEEEFECLVLALEGWFDKKLKDLPEAKQQRVERALILHLRWDQLTPEQRQGKAAQWDFQKDPAKEPERQYLKSFLEHLDKIKDELAEVESKDTLTFSEFEKKEAKVKELRQEIAQMELQNQHERGDFIHEGEGLDAEEVSVTDFIAYPKAMILLEEKCQAAVEELAVWVYLGPEQGGLAAFTNANKLNPPPRFFFREYYGQMDYLSLLQGWWFRRSDIEQFVPADRYITGTALIERWSTLPGKRSDAFIRAKIAESRLLYLHPTFGGTQGNFGEKFGGVSFPHLDCGLFSIRQIEAIEAFSLTEKQPATSHAAPLPEQEKGEQNSFIIKAGQCHIIFQGEKLYPIIESRPLREIAGRLAEPFQKWKNPVFSSREPALDAKTKEAVESEYQEIRDRLGACEIVEERECFERKQEKLLTFIRNYGAYISRYDRITWKNHGTDKVKRSFQRNIQRGIDSIRKVSPPFADHLANHLRPEYFYQPPKDRDIHWIVDLEPEKNACAHDPLEKMTDEEKKVQTREFFGTNE